MGAAALVETYAGKDTITLSNGGDYLVAGAGNDTITFTTASSNNLTASIVAGEGNDTINIRDDSTQNLGVAGGGLHIAGNQGDDQIFLATAGTLSANARDTFIGGGLGNDTITSFTGSLNVATDTTIKGGDNADSITINDGALVTSIIEGNKGADFLTVEVSASTNGSVGGGAGHDTILIQTGVQATPVITWTNGGAGTDSKLPTLQPSPPFLAVVLGTPFGLLQAGTVV